MNDGQPITPKTNEEQSVQEQIQKQLQQKKAQAVHEKVVATLGSKDMVIFDLQTELDMLRENTAAVVAENNSLQKENADLKLKLESYQNKEGKKHG